VVLRDDPILQQLVTTPLLLNILILAYQGLPLEAIAEGESAEARQEELFASYVQHMLKRRSAETRYTSEQTTHWLSRLAGQMKRQSQSIFYLEQMQPTWLAGHRRLWVYDWVAVRLPGVLMGVLVGLTINMFLVGYYDLLSHIPYILLGGLLGGLLSEGSIPQRPTMSRRKARSTLGPRLLRWLLIGALVGLGSGLSTGLSTGLSAGLIFGLSTGLSYGLCSILLQFLLGKNHTIEARSQAPPVAKGTIWQRLMMRRELRNGLLVGLLVGLSAGLSNGLSYGLDGLSYGLSYGLSNGLLTGLLAGLSAGLLIGLLTGGLASLRHYILRFLLWRTGAVPRRYVPFLDYAAERILLRKVGGGYIFLHRLLLDYFASLAPITPTSSEKDETHNNK